MNKEYFEREYVGKQRSFREISKELNISINKVIKAAKELGFKPRSKSECQSLALKNGVCQHPTKGKKLTDEHRNKIAESIHRSYTNLTDSEKEAISEKRSEIWNSMSEEKINEIRSKGINAARKASKEGSKLEKIILEALKNAGYKCQYHKDDMLVNEKLEMDIFLPAFNLCIEIDGPSHFKPIWGQEAFERAKKSDAEKNGLLLSHGISILRIQQNYTNYTLSKIRINNIIDDVLNKLKEIEKESGKKANIYYLEIKK